MRRIFWMVAAASIVYPSFIFLTRSHPRQARHPVTVLEEPDTGELKITQFYTPTASLVRGEHSVACYGVSNAVSVSIDPAIETLKPSMNRCIAITPEKTTRFTLTATAGDGRSVSESFVVEVSPPPPRIEMFAYGPKEIEPGEAFALCYRIKDAVSAQLEPIGWKLMPEGKHCVQGHLAATTRFTLDARGEDGRSDRVKFVVKVKKRS